MRHERWCSRCSATACEYDCGSRYGTCDRASTGVYGPAAHRVCTLCMGIPPVVEPECDGRCISADDIGVTGYSGVIAYPDPECSLHGTAEAQQ